ncbi:MAG TPA: ester cyclase [Streptosporangiaceae bacterium]|nr:ester cyclase [Streptosporangiaceae bacterium]
MDPDKLKAMYLRWLSEEWGQGDYSVADELIAEDLIDHNPMPGQPAGRAGEVWMAKMIRAAFPDARFQADVVVSDGEYVAGRWTMTATNTGRFELFGLPPTGRPVTMTGQEIFLVRDGKFAEVWHQEDVPGMLAALGLEPPPAMMRLAARRSARRYRRERGRTPAR